MGRARTEHGSRRPPDAPVGFTDHRWVAALVMPVPPDEVDAFQRRADSATVSGHATGLIRKLRGSADVVDVYCERCGGRPDRDRWCLRELDVGLPRAGVHKREARSGVGVRSTVS